MENKQPTLKNKILKILPKAAAAVSSITFQNPPFSPGRDHKLRSDNATKWHKSHGGKGFSGPMIPDEARRKPKDGGGIETQEPTSPTVSCIGQIKQKKKQIQKAKAKSMKLPPTHDTRHGGGVSSASSTPRDTETEVNKKKEKKKKQASNKFQRMFFHAAKPKLPDSSASVAGGEGNKKDAVSYKAPPVGQMRRFASGRETFSNFDWKAQIAPEEIDQRGCSTDVDREESDAEEEEEEEEREIIIPFSAPILVGDGGGGGGGGRVSNGGSALNLQPRKEINLWKRRTMAPPRPLQLKPVLTAN